MLFDAPSIENSQNREYLFQLGVIAVSLHHLQVALSPPRPISVGEKLTLACLGLLQNMCSDESARDCVCEHGGVETLTKMLLQNEAGGVSDSVLCALLECLRNVLCGHELARTEACQSGLGACLCTILQTRLKSKAEQDTCVVLSALHCLSNYVGLCVRVWTSFFSFPSDSFLGSSMTSKEVKQLEFKQLLSEVAETCVWLGDECQQMARSILASTPSGQCVCVRVCMCVCLGPIYTVDQLNL